MDEGRIFPLAVTQSAWNNELKPVRSAGGRGIFATIVTADRIAQSRILARSARECHPDARLVVLAPDPGGATQRLADLFDLVVTADQLQLGSLADMRFRYTTAELCFALKPWLIRHLLDQFPDEPVYYFDSDVEIFSPLAEAEAALTQGANLVVTPHVLQPGSDGGFERRLLRAGSFNAGFVGVAPSAQARAFVAWWCERVKTGCINDHPDGMYGDQKWLELAPSICDGVVVLRHPGYNFAYWNGHERPLSCLGGTWTAAGWPLRFVHYSQWDMRAQDTEEYLARYFRADYQAFSGLFAEYRKKVQEEDSTDAPAPAVYSEVLSPAGEKVPDLIRRAYEKHSPAIEGGPLEVFGRAVAVLNAPSTARRELPDLPLTVLYDEIWQRDGDLRYRFDVDRKSGRLAYLQWLVESGFAELQIPVAFTTAARAAAERERLRQLEEGDEREAPVFVPPPAAFDREREQTQRQADDIRLLVRSNKALRRELTGLRVRRWRDEETIAALEGELAPTRRALAAARLRNRELAAEVAGLRSPLWQIAAGWGKTLVQPGSAEPGHRSMLPGDGPFFARGFRLADATTITGAAVMRNKGAPAGFVVYGPYIKLPRGAYAVTLDARLYQRLPLIARLTLDIVCDGTRHTVALRRFRLCSFGGWRRFEVIFPVHDVEDYDDFEVRIWVGKGTPLEIGGLDLCRLSEGASE
jgi:hypothetical protein